MSARMPRWTRLITPGAVKPAEPVPDKLGRFMLETSAVFWMNGFEDEVADSRSEKKLARFSTSHLGPVRTATMPWMKNVEAKFPHQHTLCYS